MNFNRCEYFAPEIVHPQNREKSLGTRLRAMPQLFEFFSVPMVTSLSSVVR